MLRTRVIPCMLLKGQGLVKTVRFKQPRYVGDPINSIRIFNDKEVDELIFLDITATREAREPNYDLIAQIASEAFMPFAYGGGVRTLPQIERLLALGVEKVIINSCAASQPQLIRDAAKVCGSQSIIVSIDVKKRLLGGSVVMTHSGTRKAATDLVAYARSLEDAGAGELFLNSIDRDGTMSGYDLDLIKMVTAAVDIPVIACGGAGSMEDFAKAVNEGRASAVAAGSMFVFHGPHRAVLITYPSPTELERLFSWKSASV